ncbi:prephenate dehydratase [Mycolicibacterium murale]|jgi:hypothetical protein|uniref:Prephenate dehydratase n=1 Tax=Mycolicibacterium murale TaxID=182220 RepID=A0A7I9WEY5_9MYCO|nr:DUF2470 domain-containing protein [Mycolicibacterium murale]ANW62311.1 DUF2470 domain-containing protein [Mycobacterium sp. djl-10]MCV7182463.1 DUF2470 domain-containing protein [Mycolicibacterium murale]GFG56311.1 prephenate dehydratase [Mycolicibacterium murale]
MTAVTSSGPTTAERVRSACVRAGSALLALEGVDPESTPVHHLMADGSFATLVPTGSVAAARVCSAGIGGVQAVLELTDYAPLPLREPVRSLVWIRGRLVPVPPSTVRATLDLIAAEHPAPVLLQVGTDFTLLRLEVESVVVADSTGAEAVGVSSLLAAEPDPFCSMETCWLRHIDSDHRDVVARLAGRLPGPMRRGRVRPLGLDRYGVRLRVEGDDGDHDVRLPFAKPVDDVTALSQAIRVLMGCPFVNGLRARQS